MWERKSHLVSKCLVLSPLAVLADQLAAVLSWHPCVFGDPLNQIPIGVCVIEGVELLTLLVPDALFWKEKETAG